MEKHTIAICQVNFGDNRPLQNVEQIEHNLFTAAKEGANLALFPELSLSGYTFKREEIIKRLNETKPEMLNHICETARKHNISAVVGILEESPNSNKPYNTSVAIRSDGSMIKYRKMHICPNEKSFYPGIGEPIVADLGFVKLGLSVCYDNWFPETARMAFLKGAEVLHMPFYWPAEWEVSDEVKDKRTFLNDDAIIKARRERMLKVFPGRALDNAMYLAMVNHAGKNNNISKHLPGKSMMFNPYGDIVAEADAWVEDMLLVDIDPDKLLEWRQNIFFTGNHLRPEVYIKTYNELKSTI